MIPRGEWLLSAHDAGGAEVVAAWAAAHPEHAYRFCLAGPALAVFGRRFPALENRPIETLEAALREKPPIRILTATGWASDLERKVLGLGARLGLPTSAYLDHWVNYRERFGYPGEWLANLPDEVWCPDEESRALCRSLGFPEGRLVLAGNAYLDDLRRQVSKVGVREDADLALYVCEPIRDHMARAHGNPLHLGYDEFDAMRWFFSVASRWDNPPARFLLRPHPSEPEGKYQGLADGFKGWAEVSISRGTPLLVDIARSKVVAGCESMALAVALAAGKTVYTSIPPYARQGCRLPQAGIRPLNGSIG